MQTIPHQKQWRSITLGAGSFPVEYWNEVQPGEVVEIPRLEVSLWKALRNSIPGRILTFGDYTCLPSRHRPFKGFVERNRMSTYFRFTTDKDFILFRGDKLPKQGGNRQYTNLAQQIVNFPATKPYHKNLIGTVLVQAAQGLPPSTNPTSWISLGIQQSLLVAVEQSSLAPAQRSLRRIEKEITSSKYLSPNVAPDEVERIHDTLEPTV